MFLSRALTLIELLIALAIIIILLLIAVPSIHSLLTQNRVAAQVNQILSAINFTRSEALKRHQLVSFCGSNNHQVCNGNWREGQIVKAGEQVIRVYPALSAGDKLFWSSNFNQDNALSFTTDGFTNGQQGSFYYCPKELRYAKRIVIDQSGRARVINESVRCVVGSSS